MESYWGCFERKTKTKLIKSESSNKKLLSKRFTTIQIKARKHDHDSS